MQCASDSCQHDLACENEETQHRTQQRHPLAEPPSSPQNTQLCAEGSAKLVWVDAASGKSRPLPDDLRAALVD